MANNSQDSHLSQRSGSEENVPLNMHKMNKLGRMTGKGQSNPNGAPRGSTDSKLAGDTKNY